MRDGALRLLTLAAGLALAAALAACSGPEATRTINDGTARAGAPTASAGDGETPTADTGQGGSTPTTGAGAPTDTPDTQPTASATSEATAAATPSAEPSATATATEAATVTPTESPTATATSTIDMSGALLPRHRVVSYYGHPNSSSMGILGEFDKDEVLRLLREQAAEYEAADPGTPTVLAFELIATVAQPWPMDDGTYVAYTGDEIIGEYLEFAEANDMILILDIQIGHDTIPNQINLIRHWLEHPRVHLAIDPEFSTGANETVPVDRIPGEFIGESNGHDIQAGMEMLAEIVREHNLPPKILIVHQFEAEMIYNKHVISPVEGVQFVLDMDGFGGPQAKVGNYDIFVREELIEFGGIKMFYRQDDPLLTPAEIVTLDPPPAVVIYQ